MQCFNKVLRGWENNTGDNRGQCWIMYDTFDDGLQVCNWCQNNISAHITTGYICGTVIWRSCVLHHSYIRWRGDLFTRACLFLVLLHLHEWHLDCGAPMHRHTLLAGHFQSIREQEEEKVTSMVWWGGSYDWLVLGPGHTYLRWNLLSQDIHSWWGGGSSCFCPWLGTIHYFFISHLIIFLWSHCKCHLYYFELF